MRFSGLPNKSLQPTPVGALVCSSRFSSGVAEAGLFCHMSTRNIVRILELFDTRRILIVVRISFYEDAKVGARRVRPTRGG